MFISELLKSIKNIFLIVVNKICFIISLPSAFTIDNFAFIIIVLLSLFSSFLLCNIGIDYIYSFSIIFNNINYINLNFF